MEVVQSNIESFFQENEQTTDAPLRVLFDVRKIGDGGIGVYIENLIKGLREIRNIKLSLVITQSKKHLLNFCPELEQIVDNAKPYSVDEMFGLSRRINFSNYDIFHSPHFTLPYSIPIPTIITVHDLIHINKPEKVFYPLIAKPLLRSSLRRASKILTVSQSSFNEIDSFVRSKPSVIGKLRVVHNSLDPDFLALRNSENALNGRARIQGRYLLAVLSNLKPHKGLDDLLKAFVWLKESARGLEGLSDLKLVLAGQGTEGLVSKESLLDMAGSIKGVHIKGAVSKSELAELYQNAEALVVPSLAEGFCLPVVEAHAFGTPVISRPVPAVTELLTVSDKVSANMHYKSLAEAILNFFDGEKDQSLNKQTKKDFLSHQIKRFDFRDTARAVFQVYNEAYEERRLRS